MAVGDNQGNTYKGTEGHQRAFILGNPELDPQKEMVGLALKNEETKIKNEAAKVKTNAAKKADLDKKIKEGLPDYFYPHDVEIKDQMNKLLDVGGEIMANGGDPFNGTHPYEREFQKQFVRYNKMGEYSKQIKAMYENDRKMYDPNKHEYGSHVINQDWYKNTSLNKAVDESLMPPPLVPKNPVFELQKTYGELAQKVGVNNKDPQPQDLDQAISIMMADPTSKDFVPTIQASIAKLAPEDKKQLEEQAKAQNISPEQLLARNQFQTYFRKEPIDLNKVIDDSMPTGDVRSNVNSYEDPSGVTTGTKSKKDVLAPEKALKHAESQLVLQPQLYQAIVKGGGKNDDGTPIVNEKQAAQWLANVYQTRYKTIRESERTTSRESGAGDGTGLGEEEAKKDSDLWYNLLMRTETPQTAGYYAKIQKKFGFSAEEAKTWAQRQAAAFMKGTKNEKGEVMGDADIVLQNEITNPLTVENGIVVPHNPLIKIGKGRSQKVKKTVLENGEQKVIEVDEFVPGETETISTNPNDQAHRKQADMDTYWKAGIKTRGKRFETIFDESINATPSEVPTGVTTKNAQDAIPEKGVWNKGNSKSKTKTINTTPAELD
jgi:hypothetical protein